MSGAGNASKGLLRSGTFVLFVIMGMTGCSRAGMPKCNKVQEYQSSHSIESLQVPADLDLPDKSEALVIPDLSPTAKVRKAADPCLETPPDYFDNRADKNISQIE